MATEFKTKVDILADMWLNFRDVEQFEDFIAYNDLGLPLSYMLMSNLVSFDGIDENARGMIEETFKLLLAGLDIEEDTGFESLEDLVEVDSDFSKAHYPEDDEDFETYSEEPGEDLEFEEDDPGAEQAELVSHALGKAHDAGYEDGYSEGYKEGFVEGRDAEQKRVQDVIKMHKRWAKENKKGTEFMFWDGAGEMLTPMEIDYSEEAYRKSLEDDGF